VRKRKIHRPLALGREVFQEDKYRERVFPRRSFVEKNEERQGERR